MKLVMISAIGARDYYRRQGFELGILYVGMLLNQNESSDNPGL